MRVLVASVEPFALWTHAWAHEGAPGGARALACSEDGRTVAHANAAARAAGVRPGMDLAGARGRAPELTLVPAAGPAVDAAWEAFLDGLHDVSPRATSVRTGVAAFAGDAHDAAAFAERAGARVGGADTVEEAHLLAYAAEPGRAVLARPGEDPWTRLDAAPLYLLGGVGLAPDDRRRLDWLGVRSVGQLRRWTPAQIAAFLGEGGRELLPYLHGPRTDRLPTRRPPATVAVAHAFDDPAREPFEIDPALERLVARAADALGDRAAGRVRVVAVAEGIASDAARRAKRPLRDARRLLRLARLALEDTRLVAFGIDEVRLELSGLARPAEALGLWPQRRRREEAARAIHERFPGQARRFALRDPDALRPSLRWRLLDALSGEAIRTTADDGPTAVGTASSATASSASLPAAERDEDAAGPRTAPPAADRVRPCDGAGPGGARRADREERDAHVVA